MLLLDFSRDGRRPLTHAGAAAGLLWLEHLGVAFLAVLSLVPLAGCRLFLRSVAETAAL
jgi:hypothetical protein